MKKHLIFWSAVMAIFFAACGGSKTPSSTVKNYLNAVQSKNFEKALECFNYDKTETNEEEMKALVEKFETSVDEQGGLKSYEILSETIAEDGNSATVKITQTWGNEQTEEQEVNLTKINEEWKIELGK